MIRPIVLYGSPFLRERCVNADITDNNLSRLLKDLKDTMKHAGGAGLAAPQIGVCMRVFVVETVSSYRSLRSKERIIYFKGDTGIEEVFINPVITWRSADTNDDKEGCLSIPGLSGVVQRPDSIKIQYLDGNLQKCTQIFAGFTARIIQHEYDHIEAILYIDRLPAAERRKMQDQLQGLKEHK
ncbi:peptide deformylase [Mucilaginibacter sp. cycad4]|uniref:peptide deformylase n=1 Tax=Mucilaginibacter sp. cycad4 TaxID=3342096 RepID=UPI002AAA9569|nr:peptide deformylase [Mucilaginibacter gossypii]WPV02125.1 peptide deformylase [Mucilaginibacter gossypii]